MLFVWLIHVVILLPLLIYKMYFAMVVVNGNSYVNFDLLLGPPGVSKMAFLDPPSTRPKQSQNVRSETDNQVVDCKFFECARLF
jgi:hypothetical protein